MPVFQKPPQRFKCVVRVVAADQKEVDLGLLGSTSRAMNMESPRRTGGSEQKTTDQTCKKHIKINAVTR
jgi:hypothetical protein